MAKRILALAALIAFGSSVAPSAAATVGQCEISGILYFNPGVSTNTRGTFTSLTPETQSTTLRLHFCTGSVDGVPFKVEGVGAAVMDGEFGEPVRDNCAVGTGSGYASYGVPVQPVGYLGHGGHFLLRRAAVEAVTVSRDDATARITSALTLRPLEGDCISTPMTSATVGGIVTFVKT